jgi:arylsulfatase A-like enzyme
MSALYDGEVAAVDLFVGELLAALHARGYDESNLLVIITADHGESLGNHGFVGHLLGLPDDVLHVPLILVGPHVPSGTITEHVQPLQLRATIRALLGMPAEPAIAPPLPPWGPAPDLLITEHPEPRWYLDGLGNFKKDFEPPPKWRGNWVAVERDGTKVMFDDHGRGATYDLRRDPAENDPQPLAAGAELVEAYRDRTSRLSKARAPELEQRTIEALRQLGYVHQ